MRVQCDLCPKSCVVSPGQSGECRIRVNVDGRLLAVTWGHPCAVHVDPMEKKPLFHFLPGTPILSLATVGCNLHCTNCQNWEISQTNPEEAEPASPLPPDEVVALARQERCPSIAYTYSDPVVWYEYALDCSRAAREAGLKNVLKTAAYQNRDPWRDLCRVTDAANVDVKSMSDAFYRDVCGATLAPVLARCVDAKALGVHLEITNLVIPTLTDSEEGLRDLARWVARNLGKETPLHFSRFWPQHRMRALPPTPAATLDRAREIALAEGLWFVYVGNVLRPEAQDTRCPSCRRLLVEREQFTVLRQEVTPQGRCPGCGAEVYGRWS